MSTRRSRDEDSPAPRLDNLTLSRKEGWRRFVDAPARIRPESLTRWQLKALSEEALEVYTDIVANGTPT